MFKNLGDLANLMKNAHEIKGKLESFKASLSSIQVEGSSGGGMVRIRGRGDGTVTAVEIEEATLAQGDRALLQDLILAAMNHFQEKTNEARKEKMTELSGEIGLPPGLDLGL